MGYFPLRTGEVLSGWCGDNTFGMRTAPALMTKIQADQQVSTNSMWTTGPHYRLDSYYWNSQYDHYPKKLLTRASYGQPFLDESAADRQQAAYDMCPNPYIDASDNSMDFQRIQVNPIPDYTNNGQNEPSRDATFAPNQYWQLSDSDSDSSFI